MSKLIAQMSMSLDGFIADPADDVGPLFDWYGSGAESYTFPDSRWTATLTPASARHLRAGIARVGALVCGRRLFDLTKGWGGRHTIDVPVFVATHRVPDGWPHPEAPFTFVTDGVESAIAQAKTRAGDKNVAIASASIAQQCLNAGLLDEICVDLAPVLLGKGIPFFTKPGRCPGAAGQSGGRTGRSGHSPDVSGAALVIHRPELSTG